MEVLYAHGAEVATGIVTGMARYTKTLGYREEKIFPSVELETVPYIYMNNQIQAEECPRTRLILVKLNTKQGISSS